MLRRRGFAPAFAVFAAVVALSACTPGGGVATPTPTELTEEQAYAAAEDAFAAYIDAVNQIDVADPTTFEPAFALTTGRLNAIDRQTYSQWHSDHWSEAGDLTVVSLEPRSIESDRTSASLAACLDASKVSLIDQAGQSQVNADRQDVQAIIVKVDQASNAGVWRVERITVDESAPPC